MPASRRAPIVATRDKRLHLTLTDDEMAAIRDEAARNRMEMGAWVARIGLAAAAEVNEPGPAALRKVLAEAVSYRDLACMALCWLPQDADRESAGNDLSEDLRGAVEQLLQNLKELDDGIAAIEQAL